MNKKFFFIMKRKNIIIKIATNFKYNYTTLYRNSSMIYLLPPSFKKRSNSYNFFNFKKK